jgi:two-component system sensor histidine kinase UhpB
MRTGDAPVVEHLDEIRSLVATGISEARRSVLSLRPDPLVGATLADAIRSAGRRLEGGARIDVVVEGQERPLAEPAEDALYRVAQESLTNAIRHAGARSIEVRLRYRAGGVALVVQDDGRGFAPGNRAGQGLRGMRDRAAAIGARLQVESGPEGTTIQMEVDT